MNDKEPGDILGKPLRIKISDSQKDHVIEPTLQGDVADAQDLHFASEGDGPWRASAIPIVFDAIADWIKQNPPAWGSTSLFLEQWEKRVRMLAERFQLTPEQTYNITLAFSEIAYDAAMLSLKGDFNETSLAVGLNCFNGMLADEMRTKR